MRTWGAVDGVREQTNRRRTAGTRATRACHLNLHFAREKKIGTAYVTRSLMISADMEGVVVESSIVCPRPGLRPRSPSSGLIPIVSLSPSPPDAPANTRKVTGHPGSYVTKTTRRSMCYVRRLRAVGELQLLEQLLSGFS